MSVSVQLSLAIREVVSVEDDKFGEKIGPQPHYTGAYITIYTSKTFFVNSNFKKKDYLFHNT